MKSYVLQAFVENPWAMLPQKLAMLEEIVARHVNGEKLSPEEIEVRLHGAKRPVERYAASPNPEQPSGVAILPLFGSIFPKANLMTEMSGATSADMFGARFDQLVNDPKISSIVLDVDSPGGQVSGVEELSQKIYSARGKKPIVAVVDHQMASAAYWIGSAADEIVISPSGQAGSIGVFAVHQDHSARMEKEGVKTTLISAGKYKVEGNPYEPLGDEARAAIQERVDQSYNTFVESVARNRGIDVKKVRTDFGEGRMLSARQAVAVEMADRIGTLEETVNALLTRNAQPASAAKAENETNVNAVAEGSPSSTEPETSDEAAHEAKRLRDYLDVYH